MQIGHLRMWLLHTAVIRKNKAVRISRVPFQTQAITLFSTLMLYTAQLMCLTLRSHPAGAKTIPFLSDTLFTSCCEMVMQFPGAVTTTSVLPCHCKWKPEALLMMATKEKNIVTDSGVFPEIPGSGPS